MFSAVSRSLFRAGSQVVTNPAPRTLRLTQALPQSNALLSTTSLRLAEAGGNVEEDIRAKVNEADVVIFMKGVPEQPRCGFSNAVVQILRMHDVPFNAHNVLDSEELRQGQLDTRSCFHSIVDLCSFTGIKDFSDWPTIPQVYLKGEFVGGCDILLQMHQNGELIEELKKIGLTSALLKAEEEKDK